MNMSAEPATTENEKADPYRIVIVEDDRSQALFAEAILRGAGMLAEVVSAPERMMATMEQFSPDLVLMDLHMPGISGTTLTVQIREHPRFEQTPVVFLTGDQDPERQLEVLEHGADDFILKPVRPRHLIAAVQSRVRRARAAQVRQVPSEPEYHPVTGLYTRPALMHKLGASIPATTGGALLVEMGNAIALRNRYGYAGFESLMNDAGRLLGTIAKGQAAARLSDNAFLVVAPGLDAAALDAYARTLRDGIGYHDFHVEQESLRLRCAIGHTLLSHGFADAGSVLAAAEEAVRNAREQVIGIAAYTPPADVPAPTGGIADALRASLSGEAEHIHLAFQPVVAVAGGEDAQFQVLVRMRDAQGVEQMARDFLPAAEASGLLPALDRWVMERALVLLQKRRAESKPMRLFVSQSPRTLAQDAYAGWLVHALEQSSVEGTSLVLDIRLDDALVHSMLLRQFCERMVPAGVQFCLSQYRHGADADMLLQQLPLGYVRLAADFARQPLPPELRDEMRGVIDRAHRLGLQVIGQAVEDPQAAAALWMGGIDFIQGNLVQRAEQALDFDFQHATL
ncbi:MAG: EAL domain-containing protein [Thermomonas sp.]